MAVAKNEASAPVASASPPRVVVGSVAVEDGGRLVATGAAPPNALLRLYLNGTFVANVTTGSDGRWSLTVEHGMTGGAYAVRADQIDPSKGSVIARAEVPFNYPERLARQVAAAEPTAPISTPPSRPVAALQKPPVAVAPPAEASAAPSAPIATSPKPPVAAAKPPAEAAATPSAPVAAPKPPDASLEQHQSAAAEAPAPSRPEAAPAAPSQPEIAASAEAPPSGLATAPLSPASAPPQAVAGLSAPADAANAVIGNVDTRKVVRGDSLWRISSHFYGNGLRYKQIYEANASQIRDPWLIYPGQIFVLPRETPF